MPTQSPVPWSKFEILYPLYVYPTTNNIQNIWVPIINETISKNIGMDVILNPSNGNGNGCTGNFPQDASWKLLVLKLNNEFPVVKTLGKFFFDYQLLTKVVIGFVRIHLRKLRFTKWE